MNEDDKIIIENFNEQVDAFNTLAKVMVPTRNKGNVTEFIQAVEKMFRDKGWNYSLYCKKVTMDAYDRRQARKGVKNSLDDTATNLGNELKNVLDNMGDGGVKSAK